MTLDEKIAVVETSLGEAISGVVLGVAGMPCFVARPVFRQPLANGGAFCMQNLSLRYLLARRNTFPGATPPSSILLSSTF